MKSIPAIIFMLLSLSAFAQEITLEQKSTLTQDVVEKLASKAISEARLNNWNMSIAIVDDAARLLYFIKMDGASNSSIDLSFAKAKSAVNFKKDGKNLHEAFKNGENILLAIPGMLPLDGGYLLKTSNGEIIGAIGVSGSSAANDGQVAMKAVNYLAENQ